MEDRAERLAVVDRVEELLSHLYGEPRLCIASEACPGCVVLRFPASIAVASFRPAGQGAVCCLWAASSIIRIGKVADLAHLLQTTLGKLPTDLWTVRPHIWSDVSQPRRYLPCSGPDVGGAACLAGRANTARMGGVIRTRFNFSAKGLRLRRQPNESANSRRLRRVRPRPST